MKKTQIKKLTINKGVIANLSQVQTTQIVGGGSADLVCGGTLTCFIKPPTNTTVG